MGMFPTLHQRWRRKAIAADYPRCTLCNQPVQKEYQKRGTICRWCSENKVAVEDERFSSSGTDAVAYERGGRGIE